MRTFPICPTEIARSPARHAPLLKQLIKREILGRYRGSVMGLFWAVLNPLLLLAVYTFVFSVVFKARWGASETSSHTDFALNVFAGIIFFNLFAECFTRAPNLILHHANYVKKVVFPLEILPWMAIGSALFHFLIGLLILIAGIAYVHGAVPLNLVYLPLILAPLCLILMGMMWFLSALGVYIRDIGQIIGLVTTVLMFMSPIFYPITALPEPYRIFFLFNPLTFIIEQSRAILLLGQEPQWYGLMIYSGISIAACWMGFAWFQKTRKGFADVL